MNSTLIITALDNIRFYQRQGLIERLAGNELLRSVRRETVQEYVGNLLHVIEIELAYEEKERYEHLIKSGCTCTPMSDACELCKMSTYYKPDDTNISITPDKELPV
jgi:hypothetical protein